MRDSEGVGIAGVEVRGYQGSNSWANHYATTGADGSYRLNLSGEGDFRVGFFGLSAGYGNLYYDGKTSLSSADFITVAFGQEVTGIDATLQKAAALSGRITDAVTGAGVQGTIYLYEGTSLWANRTAYADSDGYYTIYYLPSTSTDIRLQFAHSHYLSQWYDGAPDRQGATVLTVEAGQELDGLDAALAPGATISGTVTSGGVALSGATVSLFDADDSQWSIASTVTNSQGGYSFGQLKAGSYLVRYQATDHVTLWYDGAGSKDAATPIELAMGATYTANATMVKSAAISGVVTRGIDGVAIGGAAVQLYDADQVLLMTTYSDWSDGNYRFSGLTDGTYFVRFSAASYVTNWHDGKASFAEADPIVLVAPDEAFDVDGIMRAPDLVIDSFDYPEFVAIGGSVEFTWTVRNAGDGPAAASWFFDRVYLSDDTQLNTWIDPTVTSYYHNDMVLAPGETYTVAVTGTVPSSLGLGQKYFILRIDANQNIPEPDRTNNTAVSGLITVGALT